LQSSITIPARERVQTYRSGRSEYVGGALGAAVVPPVPGERGPLQLSVLAYSLGNLWRRLVLRKRIESWSWTRTVASVKTSGRLLKHARLLAESHLTRRLFRAMLQRIWALPVPEQLTSDWQNGRYWRRNRARAKRCREVSRESGLSPSN
jgi:hypothetical protein